MFNFLPCHTKGEEKVGKKHTRFQQRNYSLLVVWEIGMFLLLEI